MPTIAAWLGVVGIVLVSAAPFSIMVIRTRRIRLAASQASGRSQVAVEHPAILRSRGNPSRHRYAWMVHCPPREGAPLSGHDQIVVFCCLDLAHRRPTGQG